MTRYLDIFETFVNAALIALFASSSVYILLKFYVGGMVEKIKLDAKAEIEAWLNSEKGQKALYEIGAIVGNGAKAGFGISTSSGKFKWQDLIGQIAGGYLQKYLPQQQGQDQQQQQQSETFKTKY